MFGKKNDKPIRVQHYDGLNDFNQDYPCTVVIKDDQFIIRRIKPETTVTLPINRILVIDVLEEENFMLKYHNEKVSSSKVKGIKKYYLVVKYQTSEGTEKHLSFWGTASEYKQLIHLKEFKMNSIGSSYVL